MEALICTRLSGRDDCELPTRRAAFVDVQNVKSRAQLVRLRRHLSVFLLMMAVRKGREGEREKWRFSSLSCTKNLSCRQRQRLIARAAPVRSETVKAVQIYTCFILHSWGSRRDTRWPLPTEAAVERRPQDRGWVSEVPADFLGVLREKVGRDFLYRPSDPGF